MPLSPGVYQFVNSEGTVIYVGKAKSLRKRVSSYFIENHPIAKVRVMVKNIAEIRHIVVYSEADALLLENNLIKTLQPRYNSMLKDDKTYPWIAILNEPFPRVVSTRRLVRDGSRYFGPYASVVMQKNILELIRGLYTLRTCTLNLSPAAIAKGRYSVCLEYHLGNCKGPCVGLQTQEDYDADISRIAAMLGGDLRSTKQWLEKAMNDSAAAMNFEQAERYKQRLHLLDNYASKSVIVSSTARNVDVFSVL